MVRKLVMGAVALGLLGAIVYWSLQTWSNPQPLRKGNAVDLEVYNRARVAYQAAWIDSVTAEGEWEKGLGGTRFRWIERAEVRDSISSGDWVTWLVRVALANDSVCFERPLAFKWQATDLPSGFHDLAEWTAPGDSVEAWLPEHRAWGLSGYGELVPPGAMIHLNYRFLKAP